jgi:hypothetical protein
LISATTAIGGLEGEEEMETLLKFKATAVLVLVNGLVMVYCKNTQIPYVALQVISSGCSYYNFHQQYQ